MLKLHGGYVLPENVPANEFLNLEGQKFSTSRNWAVWAHDALEAFPADYLRYALLGVLPETKDSDFSWKEMQARVNNELADTLGNFVNRSLTFAKRFFDGKVPALQNPSQLDREMLAALAETPARIGRAHRALPLPRSGQRDDGARAPGQQVLQRQRAVGDARERSAALRQHDPRRAAGQRRPVDPVRAAVAVLGREDAQDARARRRALERARGDERRTGCASRTPRARCSRPAHASASPRSCSPRSRTPRSRRSSTSCTRTSRAAAAAAAADAAPHAPLAATIEYDDFAKLDLRVALVAVRRAGAEIEEAAALPGRPRLRTAPGPRRRRRAPQARRLSARRS